MSPLIIELAQQFVAQSPATSTPGATVTVAGAIIGAAAASFVGRGLTSGSMLFGRGLTGSPAVTALADIAAPPPPKGAFFGMLMKSILGVCLTGALMALATWVYTWATAQWSTAGMPEMPVMINRPGGGTTPVAMPGGTTTQTTQTRIAMQTTGGRVQTSFLDEYRD